MVPARKTACSKLQACFEVCDIVNVEEPSTKTTSVFHVVSFLWCGYIFYYLLILDPRLDPALHFSVESLHSFLFPSCINHVAIGCKLASTLQAYNNIILSSG